MLIEEICTCGASLKISDSKGVYINLGGIPNNNGEKFTWQKTLREFRENHKLCNTVKDKKITYYDSR